MRRMIGEESSNTLQEKSNGQIKILEHILVHSTDDDLGLNLGLDDLGTTLGGWTSFSLFLSRYGDYEQMNNYLAADVKIISTAKQRL